MREDSFRAAPHGSSWLRRVVVACVVISVTALAAACTSSGPQKTPGTQKTPVRGSSIAFAWVTPKAVLTAVPAGVKLTPLDTAASGDDGHTLYLGVDLDGGKCGAYEVVIEPPTRTQLRVGVIHTGAQGKPCSTQETNVTLTVKVATSLDMRLIVDLATGKPMLGTAD